MNLGIIGTGNIATNGHAPAIIQCGSSLTSVLSRDVQRGEELLKNLSQRGASYTSLDDFVNDDSTELVIVASPDGLHYSQAKACLESGKHVLLEKPMTLESREAESLIEVAEKNNLTLSIGFHLRSHVGHRLLKKEIQSGAIGSIEHVRVIWAWPADDDSNWRAHNELTKWWSLSGVGSHCLDAARWLTDDYDDWKKFSSTLTNTRFSGPHDETAIIGAQLRSGTTIEVVSSVLFGPYNRLEIYGSKGTATCDDTLGREGAGQIVLNGEPMSFDAENPFVCQLRNVLANVEANVGLNSPAIAGLRSVLDLNQALGGKV